MPKVTEIKYLRSVLVYNLKKVKNRGLGRMKELDIFSYFCEKKKEALFAVLAKRDTIL